MFWGSITNLCYNIAVVMLPFTFIISVRCVILFYKQDEYINKAKDHFVSKADWPLYCQEVEKRFRSRMPIEVWKPNRSVWQSYQYYINDPAYPDIETFKRIQERKFPGYVERHEKDNVKVVLTGFWKKHAKDVTSLDVTKYDLVGYVGDEQNNYFKRYGS